MSRPNLLSILVLAIVLLMCGAFMVFGMIQLADVTMSMHGWIALGLGVVFSVALGGTLTTVLVISRRRGFDEAAHEVFRHSEPD
ncbi:hypothetical protein [Maricaulis maris]|jgi:hypothetical protein|uniref:hypothetical protein n=1 Tax=Maricaulis maris TaxID=74318 RepID=UPI0029200BF7|nr:hypothetical protein MACH15_19060 [Maricaulis maris]